MSNARQLAANLPREGGLSNRNLIINGGFDVWQRGTSFTLIEYTADRWYQTWNGSGTTRSTTKINPAQSLWDTVGSKAIRVANTGAPTGQTTNRLEQRIEDVTRVSNKDVTLSFWAKADAAATYSVDIEQNFGSGGSSTVAVGSQNVSITTSWTYFTVTFTLPSISTATIGSSHYLAVIFNLPLNATFGFELTGVQLEVGDTATPFEHRSYSDQLQACQRYYNYVTGNDITAHGYKYMSASRTLSTLGSFSFPTQMRSAPSAATLSAPTYENCSGIAFTASATGVAFRVNVSGAGNYRTTGGEYSFDAEL